MLSLQNRLYKVSNSKTKLLDEIRKLIVVKFGKLQSNMCEMLTTYFQVDLLTLKVIVWKMPSILGENA